MSRYVPVRPGSGGLRRPKPNRSKSYLASAHETVEGAAKRLALRELIVATSDSALVGAFPPSFQRDDLDVFRDMLGRFWRDPIFLGCYPQSAECCRCGT